MQTSKQICKPVHLATGKSVVYSRRDFKRTFPKENTEIITQLSHASIRKDVYVAIINIIECFYVYSSHL